MESLSDLLTPSEKRELADYLLNAIKGMGTPPEVAGEAVRKYSRADVATIEERLLKLRPHSVQGLRNCIFTMYKPVGGISDEEISDAIISICGNGTITIAGGKILYPAPRGI